MARYMTFCCLQDLYETTPEEEAADRLAEAKEPIGRQWYDTVGAALAAFAAVDGLDEAIADLKRNPELGPRLGDVLPP